MLRASSMFRKSLLARSVRQISTMKNGVFSIDKSGSVAILRFNDPNSPVNSLNQAFQDDLTQAVREAEADPSVKSLVLISTKPGCWVAGADITMLAKCQTAEELSALASHGQKMLNELAGGKPKVAAIGGSCLGGGLELALACHYRVASEEPKTSLGLPEVQLGLLPGAGGTQRLPRLIGMQNALPLMLTGKQLKANQARKQRLVDVLADPHALEHAAVVAATKIADGSLKINREFSGIPKLIQNVLEGQQFGRDYMFKQAKQGVMKQTKGKYPAPLRIIEAARTGLEQGFEKGLEYEAKAFGELGVTPESKNLISIFFGQTSLKKNVYGKPEKPVAEMGVIGAGLMGAGIVQVSIEKNIPVVLKDMNVAALSRGEAQIWANLKKKRSLSSSERDFTFGRITGVTADNANHGIALRRADLILEAVFEDMGVKHKLIKELEANNWIRDDAIFATNTSSLEVGEIAKASKLPQRVVGMHYFSPVDKMPLLEIIPHATTDRKVLAAAYDVGLRQGKTVIITKDVPGFYVNRCLGPYMSETMALLADGVSVHKIDASLTNFGMPVGPVALCDEVGADVAYHVQAYLANFLGDRMKGGDASTLKTMVEKKFHGRKTGKGFYLYESGKGGKDLNPEVEALIEAMRAGKAVRVVSEEDVALRMMLRFSNEAVFCLQDEIITSAVVGDIGAVFGVGFPPFLGGPFRWIDSFGVQKYVDTMKRFRDQLGVQFTPAPLLEDMAKANKKFHS